ncbi:carbohydrate ABC transporter permease [Paenibacillus montanisoli]|uniref:Carbohydrate ABC transporter permease n=1 Tax=Paenibacillus montanisoli TaxID=2081970 RepID=A0A328U4X7_9BACL|nr:carbohydrate ABC transporter permease [Paenibacillus montanisoli]RAP77132.1 carbohydrate ABC transporter permease [Paenibacillus montanisoli]
MYNPSIKESRGDRAFTFVNYTFLVLVLIMVAYPLLYIVSASFSNPGKVAAGEIWLFPKGFNVAGYKAVFDYSRFWTGFTNSLFYTSAGTMLNVTLTVMAGYVLSRRDLVGRNLFMLLFMFTMLFSGGLIPTYLLVQDLGLINTRWAMILPTALSVWNLIIARTFFQVSIPQELLEAAQIDGCNDFKFVWRIVLPLSAPIIAVLCLFYAVGHWNTYFNALIYLRNKELFPLQIILREILILNSVDTAMTNGSEAQAKQALSQLLKFSLVIIASLPILVIYPFVQKHFVKGVMIGSLKG